MQRIAVGRDSVSRLELDERAEQRALRLSGHRTVAVVAHPSLTTVEWVHACLEHDIVAVPVSPDAGPRERDHVLNDSGATLLVDAESIEERPEQPQSRAPSDAALLLYTSGTTGLPKGVPITRAAIDACLDGLAGAWEWTPDDTLVHGLPLHHVHGLVLGVLGTLRTHSSLVHTVRPTPAAYADAGGTLFFGVPTVWSRIARDPASASRLRSARLLVSGSAALPGPVFDALAHLAGQAPLERYGMTETLITCAAVSAEPRIRGCVGRPLPDVALRLGDEDGSLEVRGPSVFTGYLNRPDVTAESFTDDGWFRTGDIARIDDDGLVRIVGRASTDLIKSGGYRIGAGEIEDALLAHPAVREAAVVGRDDEDLGQRIVAFVVTEGTCTDRELVDFVARELSHHKRPREVVFVSSLPRNAMGKVDKKALIAAG